MPWKASSPMDRKIGFIGAYLSKRYTMTELCDSYGVSRKTGYKWAGRYLKEGNSGLEDRSCAPLNCPHRTEGRCEEALVAAKKRHPTWGPKKLLVILCEKHPGWPWPVVSTAGQILDRHGLVEHRPRRRKQAPPGKPFTETTSPNELWTADFKGEFRLGNGQLCYPLTVADHHSRFLLAIVDRRSTTHLEARPVFEHLFEKYGLPDRILTDGGAPFSSPHAIRRLSRLSVSWIKLGIEPVLIQPARPDQNGRHERMHRTLKRETASPPAKNPRAQQKRFDRFCREFNEIRPHEALAMRRPADLYRASGQVISDNTEVAYPGHFETRRVRSRGEIKWKGRLIFLSCVLSGEKVGLEEIDHGIWSVYIGAKLLARYDERDGSIVAL